MVGPPQAPKHRKRQHVELVWDDITRRCGPCLKLPPWIDPNADDGQYRFPYKAVIALSIAHFSQAYTLTQLFPYSAAQVLHLVPGADENRAGYYAGYVSSAYMVGRFLGGWPLGILGDHWGRRPVIFLGLASTAVFSVGFGVSRTLAEAIIFRFCLGLMNGIGSSVKTVASEVCSKEHETNGMGAVVGSWGFGLTFGPALGGMLAHRFFENHPFLAPNLACAALSLVIWPFVYWWVPETCPRHVPGHDDGAHGDEGRGEGEGAEDAVHEQGLGDAARKHKRAVVAGGGGAAPLAEASAGAETCMVQCDVDGPVTILKDEWGEVEPVCPASYHPKDSKPEPAVAALESDMAVATCTTTEAGDVEAGEVEAERKGGRCKGCCMDASDQLWRYPSLLVAVLLYFLFSFYNIMADELFPLWAYSTRDRGGLSMSVSGIGRVLSYSGVLLVLYQLLVFPWLGRRLGVIPLFWLGTLLIVPCMFLTPFVDMMPERFEYAALLILVFLPKVFSNNSSSSISIIINHSVPPAGRASANGIAGAWGSLGKAIGPTAIGILYAWSLQNGLSFPFDFHISFFTCAFVTLACTAIAYFGFKRYPPQYGREGSVVAVGVGTGDRGGGGECGVGKGKVERRGGEAREERKEKEEDDEDETVCMSCAVNAAELCTAGRKDT